MNEDRFLADNIELNRFEVSVEGKTAFVDYIINKTGTIYLTHTEVPRELEGKGVASSLIGQVMEEIEERELSLIPICPFVKTYLSRHPEWKKLLDEHHKF